jgi:Phage integrase family
MARRAAGTIVRVERGIFWRRDPRTGKLLHSLWFTYQRGGQTVMESAHSHLLPKARHARALAIARAASGTPSPASVTVTALLDAVLTDHEANGRASLRTVRGHVRALLAVLGPSLTAAELTSARIQAMQEAWQRGGRVTNTTINRRCETLRHAFALASRQTPPTVIQVPYVRRLETDAPRGLYIGAGDGVLLSEHLPDYLAPFFQFAILNGIRKGQLARTRTAWVDPERWVICWPPTECKARRPHVLPLDEQSRATVERLLAVAPERPWCPYLFHGRWCGPSRRPSKDYGCLGDFRKAWATACARAGLPVGRAAGGVVFHHTRNTAATDLRASGLDVADVMAIGGWKTDHMVRHYDLGDLEALRSRLTAARRDVAWPRQGR